MINNFFLVFLLCFSPFICFFLCFYFFYVLSISFFFLSDFILLWTVLSRRCQHTLVEKVDSIDQIPLVHDYRFVVCTVYYEMASTGSEFLSFINSPSLTPAQNWITCLIAIGKQQTRLFIHRMVLFNGRSRDVSCSLSSLYLPWNVPILMHIYIF